MRKGDGSKLTCLDRDGNAVADLLAKKGAKLHRVPKWLRCRVEVAERVATRAAVQLGVTTAAANEHVVESTGPDGEKVTRLVRDSEGDVKAKVPKAKKQAAAEKDKGIAAKLGTLASAGAAPEGSSAAALVSSKSKGTSAVPDGRKTAEARRTKAIVQGAGKATTSFAAGASSTVAPWAQPTREWLDREGRLLTAAATEANFAFLQPLATSTACSTSEGAEPRETLHWSSVAPANEAKPLLRPLRASRSSCTESTAKRAKLDIAKLIGRKSTNSVQ